MPDSTRLSHYDPRWKQEFEQTRSSILQSCEGWVSDVQHVGSTAISGLIARPIVDCVAVVTDSEGFEEASIFIEGLNFRVQENPAWLPSGRLLVKPRAGEATHHVFLFVRNDPNAEKIIRVRDILIGDRELAIRFEETKVHHWKCREGDPQGYEQAKAPIFEAMI